MKHYIASIQEINGEYEYENIFRFATDKNPTEVINLFCLSWYESEPDVNGDDYVYFHAGCVAVTAGECQEISKEVYDTLPYFISDMTYKYQPR